MGGWVGGVGVSRRGKLGTAVGISNVSVRGTPLEHQWGSALGSTAGVTLGESVGLTLGSGADARALVRTTLGYFSGVGTSIGGSLECGGATHWWGLSQVADVGLRQCIPTYQTLI